MNPPANEWQVAVLCPMGHSLKAALSLWNDMLTQGLQLRCPVCNAMVLDEAEHLDEELDAIFKEGSANDD